MVPTPTRANRQPTIVPTTRQESSPCPWCLRRDRGLLGTFPSSHRGLICVRGRKWVSGAFPTDSKAHCSLDSDRPPRRSPGTASPSSNYIISVGDGANALKARAGFDRLGPSISSLDCRREGGKQRFFLPSQRDSNRCLPPPKQQPASSVG